MSNSCAAQCSSKCLWDLLQQRNRHLTDAPPSEAYISSPSTAANVMVGLPFANKWRVSDCSHQPVINYSYFYIWAIYWFYNGTLNLLFLARFCKTLFLPDFLSNHYENWTPYSQSSQVFCNDCSKTSIVFFRINPGFSGSLYSWMAKDSFCLLVKWVDTALCCSSNAKGSICLLVKWADTAFWLARQLAYDWVQYCSNSGHVGWFAIHCQEGEQGAPMSRPTPPFSL